MGSKLTKDDKINDVTLSKSHPNVSSDLQSQFVSRVEVKIDEVSSNHLIPISPQNERQSLLSNFNSNKFPTKFQQVQNNHGEDNQQIRQCTESSQRDLQKQRESYQAKDSYKPKESLQNSEQPRDQQIQNEDVEEGNQVGSSGHFILDPKYQDETITLVGSNKHVKSLYTSQILAEISNKSASQSLKRNQTVGDNKEFSENQIKEEESGQEDDDYLSESPVNDDIISDFINFDWDAMNYKKLFKQKDNQVLPQILNAITFYDSNCRLMQNQVNQNLKSITKKRKTKTKDL